MRTLVVGDVHGCFDELQELLSAAALSSDDKIILLGDAFDRGPKNLQVLNFLAQNKNVSCLMGNHEEMHIEMYRKTLDRVEPSAVITRKELGRTYVRLLQRAALEMPRAIELPEATLVHAYWEPGLPLKEQKYPVLTGRCRGYDYLVQKYEIPYGRPWHELYDGDKPLIVGHFFYNINNDGSPLVAESGVYGIDTGCCRGGSLTGLLLPEFKLISVKARANYWDTIQNDFWKMLYYRGTK